MYGMDSMGMDMGGANTLLLNANHPLTQSAQNRTLPLAIWEFQGQYSMNTPMIMAVLTLTLLPMIIMFIIFQDKLVKGMTAGAVKG